MLILIAYIPGEPGEILDKNYREFYHSFYTQVSSGSTVISDAKTSNTLPAIKPVVIFTATKDTAKKGLEKSQSDLNEARLLLSNITERNHKKIKAFILSTNVQGVFSRTFITAITKINDLSTGTGIIDQKIKKLKSRV